MRYNGNVKLETKGARQKKDPLPEPTLSEARQRMPSCFSFFTLRSSFSVMAKIITFVNQKGGVGKTTSTINVAHYLAAAGKRVLLVDLDPQGNASSGLGIDCRSLERNLYHAMVLGEAPERIVFQTRTPGQHIIPAAQDLAGAEVELIQLESREYRLYNVLDKLRPHYDYILIDSPPSLGLLTINGLTASDELVIPVQTEYYALEGLSQLLATIELVRESLQPELKIMGALLTLYDRRNRLSRQVVQEVQEHFPGPVFKSVIPRSVRLAEAPSFGKSILDFDAFSKGARAYKAVAREILEREEAAEKEMKIV
jgi:chromosome partitioning protein